MNQNRVAVIDFTEREIELIQIASETIDPPWEYFKTEYQKPEVETLNRHLATAIEAGAFDGETKIEAAELLNWLAEIIGDF